jgi:hypothetical protein
MRKSSAVQTVLSDAALTPVWQKRFYDFNVSSRRKRIEKLKHPVTPVLVPEQASRKQWP